MPYDICKSITTTVDRQTYKFLKGDLTYHYTTKLVDIPTFFLRFVINIVNLVSLKVGGVVPVYFQPPDVK